MDPFTGCFISHLPLTVVYLRFALKAISLLINNGTESVEFVNQGTARLGALIRELTDEKNILVEKYRAEKGAWDLYYDVLKIAEDNLSQNDPFMLDLKKTAEKIINNCLL